MDMLEKTATEALEEDMAAYEARNAAPPSSFAGLVDTAEENCRAVASNKARLADLRDRCARDISDLLEERRRELQAHADRIARIDAGIEAVRAYERQESEVWERYINASRRAVMELLA